MLTFACKTWAWSAQYELMPQPPLVLFMQIAGTLSLHVSAPRSLLTGPEYTAFRVSEDLFNLFSEKIQCNIL